MFDACNQKCKQVIHGDPPPHRTSTPLVVGWLLSQPRVQNMFHTLRNVQIGNDVQFGSSDIHALGMACPSLQSLFLGCSDEPSDPSSPYMYASDAGVLDVIGSAARFPNLRELALKFFGVCNVGRALVYTIPSLLRCPSLADVDLDFVKFPVKLSIAVAVPVLSILRALRILTVTGDSGELEDDTFEPLGVPRNAMRSLLVAPSIQSITPLSHMSSANVLSLARCSRLEDIRIAFPVSMSIAKEMLTLMPQLTESLHLDRLLLPEWGTANESAPLPPAWRLQSPIKRFTVIGRQVELLRLSPLIGYTKELLVHADNCSVYLFDYPNDTDVFLGLLGILRVTPLRRYTQRGGFTGSTLDVVFSPSTENASTSVVTAMVKHGVFGMFSHVSFDRCRTLRL